jgi:hypothetical protein
MFRPIEFLCRFARYRFAGLWGWRDPEQEVGSQFDFDFAAATAMMVIPRRPRIASTIR